MEFAASVKLGGDFKVGILLSKHFFFVAVSSERQRQIACFVIFDNGFEIEKYSLIHINTYSSSSLDG